MKQSICIIASVFWGFFLYSQECNQNLTGKVIDFHDGIPLQGATISFNDQTVITDKNGNFNIQGLCPISYAFTVSHEDCNSQVVLVDIRKSKTKNFYLEHHLSELQEVTVTEKNVGETSSAQEQTLDRDVLDKYGSASLGDALREVTGVSSLNTGATIVKPVIQGLSGSRVLIMNNGVRMQDMEWGDEHAPNVDINAANSITVVKGASALKYGGDAIGGVIIMETQRVPSIDTLFGKTLFTGASNGRGGTLSSELVKGYENGWFAKAQGTVKRFGDLEAPDYVLSNTGVYERGVSLSFGKNTFENGWDAYYSYYKNEIGVLEASHIGNVDDLINSINSRTPNIIRDFTYDINNPKQEVTHHLGKIRYYQRFEQLGKWTTQYDYQQNQRLEFDIRRTDELSKLPSIDLELTTHTITSEFVFDAKSEYKLTTGVLGRYQVNFPDPRTGVRRLIPDYDKYDMGVFVAGEFEMGQNITLDAGIRYDFNKIDAQKFYLSTRWEERGYGNQFSEFIIDPNASGSQLLTNPVFDYHSISATGGMEYLFKEDYSFRINYALSQRAPNPSELFSDGLHHSAARIELGDLRIQQETSHKIGMSIQQRTMKWQWEISPYINSISDYIVLEPTGVELSIRGAFPVWEYRQTDALLLGLDARVGVDWTQNWKSTHDFSLVKGYETENERPLINIPAANFRNRITFQKQQWSGLEISLENQYVFRQNEFPENIEVFSADADSDVLLDINTPPDAYMLFDAEALVKLVAGTKTTVQIGLASTNLLNTNYRNYLNRQRYYADDLGRNILLKLKINY